MICNINCLECTGEYYKNCTSCYLTLNSFCIDTCPTLLTQQGQTCEYPSNPRIFVKLDKLTGTHLTNINSLNFSSTSANNYPHYQISDPVSEYKRGLYFNSSPLFSNFDLKMNFNFTLIFWLRIQHYGIILTKEQFGLEFVGDGVNLRVADEDNGNFTYSLKGNSYWDVWMFFSISFKSGHVTEVNALFNSKISKAADKDKFFIDRKGILVIDEKESDFAGWIYLFVYSPLLLGSKDVFVSDYLKVELLACQRNEFLEGTCKPCKDNCNCRRAKDCSLCDQPLCEICEDYTSPCIKCFTQAGFRPGTNKCVLCNPRCTICVFSVDLCSVCKPSYLLNHDNTCIKYCSSGDNQENFQCIQSKSQILSFKFTKITNQYESGNFSLFLGKEPTYYPDYDYLDPMILPLRGLYFNRSQCTLGSYYNFSSIALANSQTFEIYFLALEGSGVILTLNNETDNFIVLTYKEFGKDFDLSLNYLMTDFIDESYFNLTWRLKFGTWNYLKWTLVFGDGFSEIQSWVNYVESFRLIADNCVFTQSDELFMQLGNFRRMDFFKGFIYSVAIYNYKKDGSISPKACGCQNCTEEGDCLVNCKKNEYFLKGCKKCNSDCEFGCSNNENCVLHTDPYCEVFDELNTTCIKCINNTRTNTFPCQCISQGVYVMKENSCKCPDGFLIYKNACDECIRYLQPYDLDSYFLESFLEIIFDFNITLKQISCLDIFFKKDLSKFGKDFECEFNQNNTYLKIKLGKGFTLRNETIEINPTKLRGLYQECGYEKVDLSSKLRYTADIPTPVALIQMFDRISLKCQDLVADGSLSTGQLLDGLMYEWAVSEGLSEYSKIFSSDSVLVIPKKKLIPGNYTVFLTVKNKFDQTNSTYSDIEVLETETLEAKFDPLVDFICQASQDCIFPIKKLISCFPNPVISIKWEFTKGYQRLSNDQLNKFWLSQTIPSAVIIPANLFKPSSLTFRLTLTETSKMIQVSKEIRIKIKADPPKIAISRASGSISSLESLSIDATIPTDESTQIIYKWTCFYQSAPCSFYYDEANPILFVPLNITSLRIFDQFKLQVTTTTESASRYLQESETLSNSVSFNCKFVSWVVPKVNIYEISSGEQPKVFSFKGIVRLTASLQDSEGYSYVWRIDGLNSSVFVAGFNQIAVGIDT